MRKLRVILAALVALMAGALYLPMLGAGFAWDSDSQVRIDTWIHQPSHFWDVLTLRVLSLDVLDGSRPVALLSLMIDALLWGTNPAGYHATNLLLHAAVAVLLFLFAARLLQNSGAVSESAALLAAAGAALLFTVHPVNSEAVAEVGYREDLLAAFWVLAALNFAAIWTPEAGRGTWLLGAACASSLLLAVGAKENGVAGLAALIMYWLLVRRSEPRRPWLTLVGASVLLVGGFLAARFLLQPQQSVIFTTQPAYLGGSLMDALLIQPRIWTFYLRQIAWPQNLCADYGPYSVRNFGLGVSLVVLIAVNGALCLWASRRSAVALGVVIFWAGLLPVSNLMPIFRPLADRFLYLPMCGVALILAEAFSFLPLMPRWTRWTVIGTAGVAVLALSGVALERQRVWQNARSLWSDTARVNPRSWTASENLGWALLEDGDNEGATASFRRSLQLSEGKDASSLAGLALAREAAGQPREADHAYSQALALDRRYAEPQRLVKALIVDQRIAGKMELLAARQPMVAPAQADGPTQ